MDLRHRLMLGAPHTAAASGAVAHFTTDMAAPIRVTVGGGAVPDAAAVTRCGKNMFDMAHADQYDAHIRNDSGTVVSDSGNSYTRGYTPVKPSTTYTFSGFADRNAYAKRIYMFKQDKTWIRRTSGFHSRTSYTFTTDSNCYWLQFQLQRASIEDMSGIQLEEADSATDYEAYTAQEVTGATIGALRSAAGVNNVFSDAGDVSVEYWTN